MIMPLTNEVKPFTLQNSKGKKEPAHFPFSREKGNALLLYSVTDSIPIMPVR